ncbi:chorion class CB protein M5H4-like [Bombyx mori]|uniref:Chorion early B n=1 Tax=Bombyx mori TaxID=7091 RepID=A0A0K2S3R0_BOMMO|nr:chorion class CB protein M5H4-like [Bombyx mori]BAS21485.1 chorion early B [Bombyx mori]
MAAILVLFCASAVMFQVCNAQCYGRDPLIGGLAGPYGSAWGPYDGIGPYDGLGYGSQLGGGFIGLSPGNLAASCGGGLAVSSSSPITPTGLTLTSDNTIEGTVAVMGQLPFLGAVATDGAFATAGTGVVIYGCGDGAIGIVSEAPIAAPLPPNVGPGYGPGPIGYGPARGGYKGCGCNSVIY